MGNAALHLTLDIGRGIIYHLLSPLLFCLASMGPHLKLLCFPYHMGKLEARNCLIEKKNQQQINWSGI